MSLIWSRKRYFHILPKSSASPWAEFWLFQSAPCRRVCLLIPLFRKRKKKKKKAPRKPHLAQAQYGNKMFLLLGKTFPAQLCSGTQQHSGHGIRGGVGPAGPWALLVSSVENRKKKKGGLMNNSQLEEACQSLQTTTKCR